MTVVCRDRRNRGNRGIRGLDGGTVLYVAMKQSVQGKAAGLAGGQRAVVVRWSCVGHFFRMEDGE